MEIWIAKLDLFPKHLLFVPAIYDLNYIGIGHPRIRRLPDTNQGILNL
jgi:hypothetical protein